MIRQVLDIMLSVVRRVVWFKRHAVVAHGVCAMLAKAGVAATRDLAVLGSPILID